MKLLSVFLLALCLHVSARGFAQTVTLSERNASLEKVFTEIRKQTGYEFLYTTQMLTGAKKFDIRVKNVLLVDALAICFRDQPFNYVIKGTTIVITEKTTAAVYLNFSSINGQFLDIENKEPVVGVSVSMKNNSSIGASSDASGHFSLAGFADNDVFKVTHIGYTPLEIEYAKLAALTTGGSVTIDGNQIVKTGGDTYVFYLARSLGKLGEIVVTAVGIKRDEKALGYSISQVKSEQLENPQVNVFSSLQGKVTGVNISNISNNPGASVLMNIRGATSLNIRNSSASSQPLFVIDGVPVNANLNFLNNIDVGNTISNLNPNDIESITVLKGASAAALYGSDAGNGVVMITTKMGDKSKKGIGVSYSFSSLANTPFKTIKTQKEFAGGDRDLYQYSSVSSGWGPSLYNGVKGRRWNMKTQEWEENVDITSANEDRLLAFMETGMTTTHNVTVNGADKNGSFRLSFNGLRNKGVLPNNSLYRNTLSFAGTRDLSDKLKVSLNGMYMRSFSPNQSITSGSPGDGNILANLYNLANQVQPIADMKEYWLKGGEGINPNPVMFDGTGTRASAENPYWTANESLNAVTKDWTFGKAQVDWQIAQPLSVMFRTGIDLNNLYSEARRAWGYSSSPQGRYQLDNIQSFIANTDVIFNFTKKIKSFTVDANAGYNYQYSNSTALAMGASSLARPNDYNISNAATGTESRSSSWSKGKKQSVYATAQVGYKGMGYVEATGRKDWGGILEEDKNSYFYPSVSFSLIPSTIFRLPKAIDFAKLRLGIAQVGHGMGRPRGADSYSFASADWGGVKLVNIGGSLVDAHLKNEVTNSIEYGAEFNLLDNRIRADFTVFKKSHLNQLLNISVPPSNGFSSMTTNVGDVISKGYEWSITANPVRRQNTNWNFTLNYSKANAVIERLAEGFGDFQTIGVESYLEYRLAKGIEIGSMYQRYDPVFVQSGKYKGSYLLRWDAAEGFERSTDGALKQTIGNFNPDFIMGFSTNFRYKNWSLNVVANLRYGGEYFSLTMAELGSSGFLPETVKGGMKYSKGWVGGRNAEYGGFPWLPAGSGTNDVVNRRLEDLGSGNSDAVYLVGVYVNPASGKAYSDANAGDENYIVNGADPRSTLWSTSGTVAYDWIYKFAENTTLDATNVKIKEVTLTYSFNRDWIRKLKLEQLSLSFIGQNIFHWYASGYNEDPETAFTVKDGFFNQGLSRFNMPPVASWGVRLNVGF